MSLDFRFAIISDPHIAISHTIWDHPSRFHLVEVSTAALESVLNQLEPLDLNFLLLPGDLTQHGEPDNHRWLANRLAQLSYPVYVVPGNHDIVERLATERSIAAAQFPGYYDKFGYTNPDQLYYTHEILPGVRLIGLNSNSFDAEGKQLPMGRLDETQLQWLQTVLAAATEELILVMVHHNVIEHLPGQSQHSLGRRYMLDNAAELLTLLRSHSVPLIFTGHLHVQDVASSQGIYEITTGSLVSYPHPYRVLRFHQDNQGRRLLQIESGRVTEVPGWEDLQTTSRQWMGDRSLPFMLKLLMQPPLNLPQTDAEQLVSQLRYFWADIANGDQVFEFPELPAAAQHYFRRYGAIDGAGNPVLIDNNTTLQLR
jgi:3',5'-cyclic AMP phosphodiesterase CpdA